MLWFVVVKRFCAWLMSRVVVREERVWFVKAGSLGWWKGSDMALDWVGWLW